MPGERPPASVPLTLVTGVPLATPVGPVIETVPLPLPKSMAAEAVVVLLKVTLLVLLGVVR